MRFFDLANHFEPYLGHVNGTLDCGINLADTSKMA